MHRFAHDAHRLRPVREEKIRVIFAHFMCETGKRTPKPRVPLAIVAYRSLLLHTRRGDSPAPSHDVFERVRAV